MSNIEAYDETTTKTIVRFSLDISQMELSISATFRVSLYDANDKYISNKYVIIEGQDYLDWGNDDQYVINFVAQKLGFTLLP